MPPAHGLVSVRSCREDQVNERQQWDQEAVIGSPGTQPRVSMVPHLLDQLPRVPSHRQRCGDHVNKTIAQSDGKGAAEEQERQPDGSLSSSSTAYELVEPIDYDCCVTRWWRWSGTPWSRVVIRSG